MLGHYSPHTRAGHAACVKSRLKKIASNYPRNNSSKSSANRNLPMSALHTWSTNYCAAISQDTSHERKKKFKQFL